MSIFLTHSNCSNTFHLKSMARLLQQQDQNPHPETRSNFQYSRRPPMPPAMVGVAGGGNNAASATTMPELLSKLAKIGVGAAVAADAAAN